MGTSCKFFYSIIINGYRSCNDWDLLGSSRSILAGDAYHQYVAIHSLYRNILHSGGSSGFLYTFTSGLGLNLYAFRLTTWEVFSCHLHFSLM